MKVIVWFKDGKSKEIEVPEIYFKNATPMQAIEHAKGVLQREGHDSSCVDHYEYEEDFL